MQSNQCLKPAQKNPFLKQFCLRVLVCFLSCLCYSESATALVSVSGILLGQGAFGKVMKAEATGICASEHKTVVAVKMPKGTSRQGPRTTFQLPTHIFSATSHF